MGSPLRKAVREAQAKPLSPAEAAAFRYLERRWAPALRGRRIPKLMRRRMRVDEKFRALVQRFEQSEPVVDDDLDFVPERERLPNGQVRDRLLEELGDDPAGYFCRRCGDETEEKGRICSDCSADR
jgi:hypothetical protein